jgi:hypothetical protein
MLINLSNHPSSNWSEAQTRAARELFGQVTDMPFPAVDPAGNEKYIQSLVTEYLSKVRNLTQGNSNTTIHIMGEMTFTVAMVAALQKSGYRCVASTTQRVAAEQGGLKTSEFRFVKFREYGKF